MIYIAQAEAQLTTTQPVTPHDPYPAMELTGESMPWVNPDLTSNGGHAQHTSGNTLDTSVVEPAYQTIHDLDFDQSLAEQLWVLHPDFIILLSTNRILQSPRSR